MSARYTGGYVKNSRISRTLNDLPERVATAVANGVVFESQAEWEARLAERVEMLQAAGFDAYVLQGHRLFVGQFPGRVELTGRYAFDNFCTRYGIAATAASAPLIGAHKESSERH